MGIAFTNANLSLLLFKPKVRIFCVLCEKRSFTETAKQLGISQSVVSRTISDLEQELSVSLFDHTVRPIRPTVVGQSLYTLLAHKIDDIDGQLTELRLNNALLSPLRIGFVESIARTMSWPVIEQIRKDYSTVSVLTGISNYLLHQLDRDRLDAILCPDPFDNRNDLDKFFVFREPSIIILPPNSGLPADLSWKRLQFSGLPIVQYNNENSGGKLQQKFFNKLGISFVSRVEVDINALLLDYVAHGVGWALTRPSILLQHPELAQHVEIRPMPKPIASREIYVISRKGHHSQLAAKVASVAGSYFKSTIARKMCDITPWIAPYLFVGGGKPEERIPAFDDTEANACSDVFVL